MKVHKNIWRKLKTGKYDFTTPTWLLFYIYIYMGHEVAQSVEAQRHKPKGRRFDS